MNTRTVVITGALTGIGRATALAFAREGASIVVSGRHDDKGKALVAKLQERGAEAGFIRAGVRHAVRCLPVFRLIHRATRPPAVYSNPFLARRRGNQPPQRFGRVSRVARRHAKNALDNAVRE